MGDDISSYDYISPLSDFNRIVFQDFKDEIEDMELSKNNRQWINDMCLIRYLRARDFNLPKAKEMIMETLEWRDEYKPFNVTRQDVLPILEIRSMYRNGMDKMGRPIIYVKPSYNPHSVEERIQSLVYILEEATLSMRSLETGVEKMCWILDFEAETKVKKRSADGTTVARQTIHLLQSHYPERLGIAFVLNAPWYMRMLWKIVSVFMHSVTRNKFIFLTGSKDDVSRELLQHIDEAELESCYGGSRKVEPDEDCLEKLRVECELISK